MICTIACLIHCLTGPNPSGAPEPPRTPTVGPCCQVCDTDGDGDIDLRDFAAFQIGAMRQAELRVTTWVDNQTLAIQGPLAALEERADMWTRGHEDMVIKFEGYLPDGRRHARWFAEGSIKWMELVELPGNIALAVEHGRSMTRPRGGVYDAH